MRSPRVKRIHKPVRLSPTLINIGGRQMGIGAEIDDADGTLWHLLGLMDGSRTREQVIAELIAERPEVTPEEASDAMEAIIDAGYVEDAGAPPPQALSPAEIDRYDRAFNYFGWIDLKPRASRWETQARLKASSVVVLGLGGTGSAVAASLVAAGVGAVHCVDFDVIEPGNLTRQLLYTEDDVGKPKVPMAVERLARMNRHVTVTGEQTRAESADDIAAIMRGRDLLVLCADQPLHAIREWTNRAALGTGTPWLIAQYAGPMAVIALFVPGRTGCHACLPSVGDRLREHYGWEPQELFSFTGHAVIAPAANLTGHLAALEAVYHLADLPVTALGRMYHLSLTDLTYHYAVAPRSGRKCETCGWVGEEPQ
ncbi:HesA/MoeB/ThiF family protein [Allorhizocola rhizosphaerae]|uniref:HesA/MoeB/ThiF family protein n=1 Tax=Allorhizocola rhizosphaerae TaxID=1872709 RepID=UPI0013C2B56E|nr:ThiF family adenylyltransferase [Allorhizocola rhizosphaerae]